MGYVSNINAVVFDDNRCKNPAFDNWSGGVPVDWSVDAGTVSQSSDTFLGQYSVELGVNSILSQQYNSVYIQNQIVKLRCWVKTSTASAVRIALSDGVGTSYSDYHSGSGAWEELEVERSMSGQVIVKLITEGVTAKFDAATLSFVYFDSGYVFDSDPYLEVVIESEISLSQSAGHYIAREIRDLEMEMLFDIDIDYVKFIDLMPLIPEKFHGTETLLEDFVYQMGRYVGTWISKIDELRLLQDPYSVDREYIHHLAYLIGLDLIEDENTTLDDLRNQLANAISWYRVKGTYPSLKVVLYLSGFRTNVYDLYTNDYVNFVRVSDWFVANSPGENPSGLDSSYYKSPHFGVEIVLDRQYGTTSSPYLWKSSQWDSVYRGVESMRPVNTVPHYNLLLNPITVEDEQCHTTTEGIITKVTTYWQQSNLNFDMGTSLQIFFDEGKRFDRPREIFLDTVTKWKLGTGNKSISPCTSGFSLDNVVLTGTISNYTLYTDRVVFEFETPISGTYLGLSELALCLNDSAEHPVVYATFPDVDKVDGTSLRVLVTVYFM